MLDLEKCDRSYIACLVYIWYDGSTEGELSSSAIGTLREAGLLQDETITDKGLSWIKSRVGEVIEQLSEQYEMGGDEYSEVIYKCLDLLDISELPRFLVHKDKIVRDVTKKVLDIEQIREEVLIINENWNSR